MFKRLLISVTFILLCTSAVAAQRSGDLPPLPGTRSDRELSPLGSPAEEMRKRAMIRHEENSYREMLERAKECAQIAAELRAIFERTRSLSREDLKRLERMEKLARKIRSGAGGSDDDEELQNPPAQLETAFARLAELSEQIRKMVEKTSRLVVSASVIERSNELIELIALTRMMLR
jgi:hypothetical protein